MAWSLALTIPKEPTEFDDGLLIASKVAQLKLDDEWVVLSALSAMRLATSTFDALAAAAQKITTVGEALSYISAAGRGRKRLQHAPSVL